MTTKDSRKFLDRICIIDDIIKIFPGCEVHSCFREGEYPSIIFSKPCGHRICIVTGEDDMEVFADHINRIEHLYITGMCSEFKLKYVEVVDTSDEDEEDKDKDIFPNN